MLSKLFFSSSKRQINSSLLARFSHELRTHLTGVVGYAEFLEASDADGMTKFTAKIIKESSLLLSRVCSAFFDLNNLKSGDIRLSCSRFLVSDLVRDLVLKSKGISYERGVYLGFSCSDDALELEISTDIAKLGLAIDSLFNGVIQFLAKNSSLHVFLDADKSRKYLLVNLEILNISEQSSEVRLHEIFWNSASYNFKLQEGPGVVLALAKEILFFMGARTFFDYKNKSDNASLIISMPYF